MGVDVCRSEGFVVHAPLQPVPILVHDFCKDGRCRHVFRRFVQVDDDVDVEGLTDMLGVVECVADVLCLMPVDVYRASGGLHFGHVWATITKDSIRMGGPPSACLID